MNIEQKIDKLEQELNELKKQARNCMPKYWKPKDGERAWFIMGKEVSSDTNWNKKSDKEIILIGNCFKTEEEAKKSLNYA